MSRNSWHKLWTSRASLTAHVFLKIDRKRTLQSIHLQEPDQGLKTDPRPSVSLQRTASCQGNCHFVRIEHKIYRVSQTLSRVAQVILEDHNAWIIADIISSEKLSNFADVDWSSIGLRF